MHLLKKCDANLEHYFVEVQALRRSDTARVFTRHDIRKLNKQNICQVSLPNYFLNSCPRFLIPDRAPQLRRRHRRTKFMSRAHCVECTPPPVADTLSGPGAIRACGARAMSAARFGSCSVPARSAIYIWARRAMSATHRERERDGRPRSRRWPRHRSAECERARRRRLRALCGARALDSRHGRAR